MSPPSSEVRWFANVCEENSDRKKKKKLFETVVENVSIDSKFMSEEPVSKESVNNIIRKYQNHPRAW